MKKIILTLFVFIFGFFFLNVLSAHAASLYYNNATFNGDWNTLGNWWQDAGFTTPAVSLPTTSDDVYISSDVNTNSGPIISINTITVSGGYVLVGVDLTVANGATFTSSSYNSKTITGNASFSDTSFNTDKGVVTGNAIFNNTANNSGTINGNATFNNESLNYSNGVISTDATFNGSARNLGTVSGNATFNGLSYNDGTILGNAIFNYASGGIINLTNSQTWRTVAGSVKGSDNIVITDFVFNDTSSNNGTVPGNATFNNSSFNNGTVSGNAIFYGDLSTNSGTISGIKTRHYTINTYVVRDFTFDGPWTVIADGVLVDIYQSTYGKDTTLSELNGGHFITDASLFVTTSSDHTVDITRATLNATIDYYGGSDVIQHGFIYGTDPTLSTGITTTTLGAFAGTSGPFTEDITNLTPGPTYYYKAYATNGTSTAYGGIYSFSTLVPTIYWYNTGVDNNWTTLEGNWWTNANHTTPALSLPTSSDIVSTIGTIGPVVDLDTWISPTNIDASVTGISFISAASNILSIPVSGNTVFGGNSINFNNIYGNVTFNDTSSNQNCGFFGSCPNFGNVYGDAIFNDESTNVGTVIGNATFNDQSYNYYADFSFRGGLVEGNATFNDKSYNHAPVIGNAIFNDSSYNENNVGGNATFNDLSYNNNTVQGNAVFNDKSYNRKDVIFEPKFAPPGGGPGGSSGLILHNASFYDLTANQGDVSGNACFATTASQGTGRVVGTITTCAVNIPTVTTSSFATINSTSIFLLGTITETGGESANTIGFNYGLKNTYGLTVSQTGNYVRETFGLPIPSLTCGTTYHYQAYATNSAGTGEGDDNTFTTKPCTSPNQILYGIDGAGQNPGTPNLYTINPATGKIISTIGSVGEYITGLAFNPITGILYGTSGNSGTNSKSLFTINTTTGVTTFLGGTGSGYGKNATYHAMPDIAFRSDGRLYGVSTDGILYTIDFSSCDGTPGGMCETTAVGDTGLKSWGNGIAFDSADNLYFFGNGDDGYYQLNPDTGAVVATNTFTNASGNSIALGAAKFNDYDVPFIVRTDGGDSPYDLISADLSTHSIITTGEDNPDMLYISAIAFSPTAPIVISSGTSSITKTSAILDGNITNTGGRQVTERGFEWGPVDGYTNSSKQTASPYSVGEFSANITDLECGKTYRYHAYATNAQGTNYGEGIIFNTTKCAISSGGGGGGTTAPVQTPDTVCPTGDKYSSTTGLPCASFTAPTSPSQPPAPVCSIIHTLMQGNIGDEVKCLQAGLNTRLNTNLVVDGKFGSKTKAAVIKFQLAHGLKGDGIFGILSRAAWNK